MNRINGYRNAFSYIRRERARTVIGYGLKELGNGLYEWYEVYLYKKKTPIVDFDMVKEAILKDIDSQTDEQILSGFVWNDIPVWLSSEHQFDYKAAYDIAYQTNGANLPIRFKLGEDDESNPIYHTFKTIEELSDFYIKGISFINQTLEEGWARKDSINWEDYVIHTE